MDFIGQKYLKGIELSSPFVVDGQVIGYPFNLEQVVNRFGKEIIPDELGIYQLFYNDQLVYVGMSKSIRGRLRQHLKDEDMPFNNVLWFCSSIFKDGGASIKETLELEYRMIKRFKPVLNSMHANCR